MVNIVPAASNSRGVQEQRYRHAQGLAHSRISLRPQYSLLPPTQSRTTGREPSAHARPGVFVSHYHHEGHSMNRIYSKVWNQSTGQVIVASELAKAKGKGKGARLL